MKTEFPDEYDSAFYQAMNPDLAGLDATSLQEHYRLHGQEEGRFCGYIKSRKEFLDAVPLQASVLEIGPFIDPCIRKPKHNVDYFDVLDRDGLIARARALIEQRVFDPERFEPLIDTAPYVEFVEQAGDLSVVNRTYDFVLSSHCAEHQPDLIGHLNGVADILNQGGHYLLILPDRRYCFDHFLPPTRLIDVIGAHLEGRRLHPPTMVLEHRLEVTHNDPLRHWKGDHGERRWEEYARDKADLFPILFAEARSANNRYIDVHNWKLTPETFRDFMGELYRLHLTRLEPVRVYPTLFGSMEFYAVLRKSSM